MTTMVAGLLVVGAVAFLVAIPIVFAVQRRRRMSKRPPRPYDHNQV